MKRFELNVNYNGQAIGECHLECRNCKAKAKCRAEISPRKTIDGVQEVGLYLSNEARDCALAERVASVISQKHDGSPMSISIPKTDGKVSEKIDINLYIPGADRGSDYMNSFVGGIILAIEDFDTKQIVAAKNTAIGR